MEAELARILFFVSLITGLLFVGAEIFVPGGVLGTIGALGLIAAMVLGFVAYPAAGPYLAVGIIVLTGIAIALWIRIFPKTPLGRRMAVSHNLGEAKGTEEGAPELLGKTGEALSALHPGGFARIAGRRVDVITEGGMIARGEQIRVVQVEGNRIVVAKAAQNPPT